MVAGEDRGFSKSLKHVVFSVHVIAASQCIAAARAASIQLHTLEELHRADASECLVSSPLHAVTCNRAAALYRLGGLPVVEGQQRGAEHHPCEATESNNGVRREGT